MIYVCILAAITVIFATVCILFRRKNRSFEGMVCKFMASFGFISIAVTGNYLNNSADIKYFSLVLFALMFGFCGDVFLGIKEIAPSFKKKLILLGTAFFLIGHIFCVIAFSAVYKIDYKVLIFFIAGIILALAAILLLKLKVNPAFAGVLTAYYGLLVMKVGITVLMVYSQPVAPNILLLISSCLFIISDTCIGLLYFAHVKSKNAFVTAELSTYYIAQILLAMSVVLR